MSDIQELTLSPQQGGLFERKAEFLLVKATKVKMSSKPKPPNLAAEFYITTFTYCNGKFSYIKTERTEEPYLIHLLRVATDDEKQEWLNIK